MSLRLLCTITELRGGMGEFGPPQTCFNGVLLLNIFYKKKTTFQLQLSGSIVRLADTIISQIIKDHYRTGLEVGWGKRGWGWGGGWGGVETTTDMF